MAFLSKIKASFANLDKYFGLADSALLSLFRFACGIALARIAGAESFGTYILLISVAVIFQTLATSLYLTPLLNLGNGNNKENYQTLQNWARRHIIKAACVFVGLGSITLFWIPAEKLSALTGFVFLFATAALLLQSFYRVRLQLEFKQVHALRADGLSVAIHIVSSLTLWQLGIDPQNAFWLGALLSAIAGSYLMLRSAKVTETIQDSTIEQVAASNGHALLVGSLANSACSRTLPFIIGIMSSLQSVAIFGVAWTLIGPIRMLSMALSNLLRPRLSLAKGAHDSAAFKRTYQRALGIVLFSGVIATVAVTLLGSILVEQLFGPELAAAGSLLPIAMMYATIDAFTTCQMVARQIDDSNGATHTARFRIYAAILSLTLLVPMTHYFGLPGSIGSLIIAEIFYGVFVNVKK